MSFCIQCGAPLKTGDHFCRACGAASPPGARSSGPAPTAVIREIGAPAPVRDSRRWWIAGAVGCAGLGLLGVMAIVVLYRFGHRDTALPSAQTPVVTAPVSPAGVPEIVFRQMSHPEHGLFYEIPADWEETGRNGDFRSAPPAAHPDAGAVWVRVRSIPVRSQGAEKAVADALGEWLTSLSALQIDRTYTLITRPGGEVITEAESVGKDEVLLFSTVVDLHFSDPASGKRWRALFAASHQADGRADFSYLSGIASLEERWTDFGSVFLRLLGNTKIAIEPK